MKTWQIDLVKLPMTATIHNLETPWLLLICQEDSNFKYEILQAQNQVNLNWLISQIKIADAGILPDRIQVFRPQSLGLIQLAGENLNINVCPIRNLIFLKEQLTVKAQEYNLSPSELISIESPPPQPLPDHLWGEEWQFATLKAAALKELFSEYPIPIKSISEKVSIDNLKIGDNVDIPGTIIYGGKQSRRISQWLSETSPLSVNYLGDEAGGLLLEAGLNDRWILVTFNDTQVSESAKTYETRKQLIKGLHFLLIAPDRTGMTYSGLWILSSMDN